MITLPGETSVTTFDLNFVLDEAYNVTAGNLTSTNRADLACTIKKGGNFNGFKLRCAGEHSHHRVSGKLTSESAAGKEGVLTIDGVDANFSLKPK